MKTFRSILVVSLIVGVIAPSGAAKAAGPGSPSVQRQVDRTDVENVVGAGVAQHGGAEDVDLCADDPGWRCGYIRIPAREGSEAVDLHYNVRLPVQTDEEGNPIEVDGGNPIEVDGKFIELPGPFPTALVYQGYGTQYRHSPGVAKSLTARGFAVMLVTVRGTVCSGGAWYPYSVHEPLDAKYIIDEWIPVQSWSNGDVVMVGYSYSAITQIPVATAQPEHLRAIVPLMPMGDVYRDGMYPGGILNRGGAGAFPVAQTAFASLALTGETHQITQHQQPRCVRNQLDHVDPTRPYLLDAVTHPYDGDFWQSHSPSYDAADITVPVLLHTAWQDQVLSSRVIESLSSIPRLHAIVTNGDHGGTAETPRLLEEVGDFLDHYVMGIDNGYDEKPRVQVWWETNTKREPRWTTDVAHWPAPQAKDKAFFLSGGASSVGSGVLEEEQARVTPGSRSYAYAPPSGDSNLGAAGVPAGSWSVPAPPGGSLTYTSAPLAEDMMVLGSGSLDLWLASTAIDTDLQVTISEVRDSGGLGEEVFVQQGWLRASHRALDEARSRPTMPYHTHLQGDAQMLTPGQPTPMRIAIFPFGHVFRAGSRVRITITPPKTVADVWSLAALPVPAVNTIFHDPTRPSQLVLPVIPGRPENMPADPPVCGSLLAQPCRVVLP